MITQFKIVHVPAHYNRNARYTIPGYFTPDLIPTDGGPDVWPCRTEQEAIEAGNTLLQQQLAIVPNYVTR